MIHLRNRRHTMTNDDRQATSQAGQPIQEFKGSVDENGEAMKGTLDQTDKGLRNRIEEARAQVGQAVGQAGTGIVQDRDVHGTADQRGVKRIR